MSDTRLSFDYTCPDCDGLVGVTVQCSGRGVDCGVAWGTARVNVPCPTCGEVNEVYFESDGTVVAVRPYERRRAASPSAN